MKNTSGKHLTHFVELTHTLQRAAALLIKLFFHEAVLSWSMWIGNALNDRFRDMEGRLDQLKRETGWGRVKERHPSALISVTEQGTSSKALQPYLIKWCCALEDRGQLTGNTGNVYNMWHPGFPPLKTTSELIHDK